MERHEILEMMGALQLAGMRAAYDEIVSTGMKRQQGFERVIGALLKAEIAEKQARSIRYQMGSAKLPLAKELPTSPSTARRSTSNSCTILPAARSSTASATSSSSAAPARARATSP